MRQAVAVFLPVIAVAGPGAILPRSGSEQPWTEPQETDVASMSEQESLIGFSPKPTPPPPSRGLFGRMDLMPRLENTLGPQTCGFSSNGETVSCTEAGSKCMTSGDYLDCCGPNEVCEFITTCYNFDVCKSDRSYAECCPRSENPSCYTEIKIDSSTLSWIRCATTGGNGTILNYNPMLTTGPPATPTASSTSSSLTTAVAPGTETGNGGGGDQTNVGAIVGGVVGGTATLGLLAIAAVLLFRRRDARASSSPMTPVIHNQPPVVQSQPHATYNHYQHQNRASELAGSY